MASKPFASGHILAAADVNDLVGILDRSTGAVDIVNSAAEANLYSAAAIAAGAMSSNRMVRCTVLGDYLNDSGSSRALTVSVYWGGGYLYQGVTPVIAVSANRRAFRVQFEIANLGATNAQVLTGRVDLSTADLPAAGLGKLVAAPYVSSLTAAEFLSVPFGGTGAVDTTAATNLFVTVQHSAANASLSVRKKYAMLELL